jgi:hypothetical protein
MSTLANFGGMSLDHHALDHAVSAWRQQSQQEQGAPQQEPSHV